MDEEVGVSVSEEEMIDSLFYRCDTLGEGKVHVYTVIQFLKNCLGNGNNEPDLLELAAILESECTDGKIDLSSYRQAVRQWVTEIRNRCESTSFLEPDGPLNSPYNLGNNSTDRSLCIETSGIGDGSFHKTEHDIEDLLQELEDLKFHNRKLSDEQTQLRNQLDTQEEVATNLTTELHNRNKDEEILRKKIKSLQDLVDLRQCVMDENEELKTKLLSTQELKRDLDSKVVSLERENVNLESQVRNYESKWQKACTELDVAKKELQQLHSTYLEQKDLLLTAQEAKSTQDEALSERNEEISGLKERLNQLMKQNEKLQEEKEDLQVKLAQRNGQLQRYKYQSKEDQLSDESLTGNNTNGVERLKVSPRLKFSTPLAKHSICMELKDRLNEDKNLPSPFCEKLELSTDVNYLNRRSVLLPTYMSAWDFEVSNGSLQDYSLELLKNRNSLSPGLYDADIEKKIQSLKDLEKDSLQKEIVKLFRTNLDLAEKCHKAELKEAELREDVNNTNHKHEIDKRKYEQIEESLETSRAAREVDLKDLWRLVHSPDEEDSTESEISLSSSTEQLKEQIRHEIEALRNKLSSKEKALTVLRLEKSKVPRRCNKRASNSPLVEALNIDSVKITRRQAFDTSEKRGRQRDSEVHTCNRSVPLMRKHSGEDNFEEEQCSHGDNEINNCENTNRDQSHIDVDILSDTKELDSMYRKDIPERFRSDSSIGCECFETSKQDVDGMFRDDKSPRQQKLVAAGSGENVYSGENQDGHYDWREKDEGINFRKPRADNVTVHRDEGHAMLRRKSYRKAIENPESSAGEIEIGRPRSDSFQNAIEQGQVSLSSLSETPPFSISDTVSDTTPEYEASDSLSLSTAPRFFSTPLSIDTVKAVQVDKKTCGKSDSDTLYKDTEKRLEQDNSDLCPMQLESKQQSTSLQAQLFKAGGLNPDNSHQLSILLEEEANGGQDSLCSHSISSGLNSPTDSRLPKTEHFEESGTKTSPPSGFDCSVEIWSLSRSSEPSPDVQSSRDSGHSSSITSFEKVNMKDSNARSDTNSCQSSPISGSPVSHSTSISTSESPISSVNYTSSYNASESPPSDPDIKNAIREDAITADVITDDVIMEDVITADVITDDVITEDVIAASKNIGNSFKPVYQTLCSHHVSNSESYDKKCDINAITEHKVNVCTKNDDANCKSSSENGCNFQNSGSKSCKDSESNIPESVPTENGNCVSESVKNDGDRFIQSPKRQIFSYSYESERNLSPSERILQRSAANKLGGTSESKSMTNHVHLPNRITPVLNSVEAQGVRTDDVGPRNKKGLKVFTGGLPVKEDEISDHSEPPSPAICFFKIGENGVKNPEPGQNKHAVSNGLDSKQALVPGESPDHGGGEGHRFLVTPNLSKIRESHLAKRRDYIRQNKMPELSELSEKDSSENNNEEKQIDDPVIKPKENGQTSEMNGDVIMPSIPDEFLQKLGLTQNDKSSEELSDQEIESKFTSLSLAFKTDSQTLEKRLEIQERSRDIAEQNVDKELQGLRSGLETLNQICTDPQVREVLTKIQNHIDILEKSTARVSSRAEVFGAIQQEKRMSKAVDIMVHHVENIRRVHEREHAELEEARKLLQDSRSLAPSTIELPGGELLSRRSASVCQNNMFGGKLSPQGGPTLSPLTPSTAKAIKLLKASRRRVSEIALPKVLGGTGAATLHPSASMDSFYTEPRSPRASVPSLFRTGTDSSIDEEEGNMTTAHIDSESNSLRPNFEADARSRFQAVIASTTVKTAVANTLRRASLEKQNHVQSVSPAITPQVSTDNSAESANKHVDVQDKEKQKNLEEEAFKKGYEQGMRASLGKDLSSLREQQNNINESLGEIMDSIDNQIEEPKSLKELLTERFNEMVPKIKISGWRIRMTMGCFFVVMAILSVIVSLFPVGSASLVGYRHYGRPPL